MVENLPIMRRCKDDWVNATQILKLCNFPKAKRTKILEKGVQQGLHEKVQGGYGRFQGTWIPLADARNLAEEYGISEKLVPVLYIDLNDQSVVFPKKAKPPTSGAAVNKDGTPVKRKYIKRKKDDDTPKKLKFEDLPPQAVFTQDYNGGRSISHMPDMPMHMPQMVLPPTFQQLEFTPNVKIPANYRAPYGNFPGTFPQQPQQSQQQQQHNLGTPQYVDEMGQQVFYHQHQKGALSQSTNETNWSQEEHTRDSDTSFSSVENKQVLAGVEEDNSHASQLLRFFSEDNAPIPYFLYNPPPDFDINEAIDDEGHTTLHWAASIGNLNLVHLVLLKGANSLVQSNFGMNPLSKCVSFNNCFDLKNFPHVVDALEMCVINTDINGRTPLHYLCQFSKVKSKLPALIYYLDVIFNKLRMMAENSKSNGVDLLRNVIDHQDVNGDTCLHLAARAGCTELVKVFLSNGAKDDLLNVNNETPKSIIIQLNLVVYSFDQPVTESQPTFQVPQDRRISHQGLGTPIQALGTRNETPDTQRTTIQDDDDEDVHDRVSKEHLRTLLEEQAGTVDDNKENIFVKEQVKQNYDSMSTPKHSLVQHGPPRTITTPLGKPKERPMSREATPAPRSNYLPKPPQVDTSGHIMDEGTQSVEINIPTNDVKSIMHGMINSLTNSYEQELTGLKVEFKRINSILIEKKKVNEKCTEKVGVLLHKNGFGPVTSLTDAEDAVKQEVDGFELELRGKMSQLVGSLEKAQAFELANLVHNNESKILTTEVESDENRWELGVALTRAQFQRNYLVDAVATGVKSFAVSNKMNKYRKLISLSCGLRVEDIDGLIDGIEESLMNGTM